MIEPGSCFAGSLLELALAADRSFQLAGVFEDSRSKHGRPGAEPAAITLGDINFGPLTMSNGLTRLQTRFWGDEASLEAAGKRRGAPLEAEDAADLGLITFAPDDIDWDEEIRIATEERASFSPDALTGLEANYRFAGPETHGDEDLRPAVRLAELDIQPAQRLGPGRRAAPVRHRPACRLRPEASLNRDHYR